MSENQNSEYDIDFDASPILNHGKLASYEWGAGELTFSPEASLRKDLFTRSLIEIAQGFTSLETRDDLLCLVSLVHEYRHFQQDLMTGFGNWDYVARLNAVIERFSLCKYTSGDGSISDGAEYIRDFYDMNSERVTLSRPIAKEIEVIGEVLERDFHVSRELASLFTTRRILEMDAVLYTSGTIKSLKMSKLANETLLNMGEIYEFVEMPPLYAETITFCLSQLHNTVIDDEPPQKRIQSFLFSLRVILNLSLMHPSPDLLDQRGHTWQDYLPGVRLVRLLRATADLMKDSAAIAGTPEDFDRDLCARTGFPYPTYKESLYSWDSQLATLSPNPFQELTQARLFATRKKLYQDNEVPKDNEIYRPVFAGENALSMITYDLPLFATRTDGGEQAMTMTGRAIVSSDFAYDRKRAILAWRLSSLAVGARQNFSCPLTGKGYCTIQTERCSKPFERFDDLPKNSECRARATVTDTSRQRFTL
jgi:hypothetical protein